MRFAILVFIFVLALPASADMRSVAEYFIDKGTDELVVRTTDGKTHRMWANWFAAVRWNNDTGYTTPVNNTSWNDASATGYNNNVDYFGEAVPETTNSQRVKTNDLPPGRYMVWSSGSKTHNDKDAAGVAGCYVAIYDGSTRRRLLGNVATTFSTWQYWGYGTDTPMGVFDYTTPQATKTFTVQILQNDPSGGAQCYWRDGQSGFTMYIEQLARYRDGEGRINVVSLKVDDETGTITALGGDGKTRTYMSNDQFARVEWASTTTFRSNTTAWNNVSDTPLQTGKTYMGRITQDASQNMKLTAPNLPRGVYLVKAKANMLGSYIGGGTPICYYRLSDGTNHRGGIAGFITNNNALSGQWMYQTVGGNLIGIFEYDGPPTTRVFNVQLRPSVATLDFRCWVYSTGAITLKRIGDIDE